MIKKIWRLFFGGCDHKWKIHSEHELYARCGGSGKHDRMYGHDRYKGERDIYLKDLDSWKKESNIIKNAVTKLTEEELKVLYYNM